MVRLPQLDTALQEVADELLAAIDDQTSRKYRLKAESDEFQSFRRALTGALDGLADLMLDAGLSAESSLIGDMGLLVSSEDFAFELALILRSKSPDPDVIEHSMTAAGLELPAAFVADAGAAFITHLVDYLDQDESWTRSVARHHVLGTAQPDRWATSLSPVVGVHADIIRAQNVVNGQQILVSVEAAPRTADALRQSYLNYVLESCRTLSLEGIDPKAMLDADARLQLDAVYVDLLATDAVNPSSSTSGPDQETRVRVVDKVLSARSAVILGDPGSGKTTFTNYLALCLAGEGLGLDVLNVDRLLAPSLLDDQMQASIETELKGMLPVRIVLRDFAARGLSPSSAGTAEDILSFVAAELGRASLGEFVSPLQDELSVRGGVFIFDGLDEVPQADTKRVQIKNSIESIRRAFPKCRLIVTSRTYAYRRQDWALQEFEAATLAPFTRSQIERFVDNWYAHLKERRGLFGGDSAAKAELLKEAIMVNDRLLDLATRPLLLTLIASLHAWRGGALPDRREELYSDAVDLLLESWEGQRVVYGNDGAVVVIQPSLAEWLRTDRQTVRSILNKSAFDAHSGQTTLLGTADVPAGPLVTALSTLSKNPDVRPARLLEYLSDRAGLLVARGADVYSFPHRTFQEYLAACHLTDENFPDNIAQLTRADPQRWREVALLAGAKAARGASSSAWLLIEALCFREPDAVGSDTSDMWGAIVATQVFRETIGSAAVLSPQHRDKVQRLSKWAAQLLTATDAPAAERGRLGVFLDLIDEDERRVIKSVDEMEFCYVPAGPFVMGGNERLANSFGGGKSTARFWNVDLNYGYWMARFPLSNQQWSEFDKDGGYADKTFWPEASNLGVWSNGAVHVDGERLFCPPVGRRNAPRVGIGWYEARAFTLWATSRWKKLGWIPADHIVSLASEPEWEKAARGGLSIPRTPAIQPIADGLDPGLLSLSLVKNEEPARRFPWGDVADSEKMAYQATGILEQVVGIFPGGAGPYGVEEQSGGNWEWVRSCHGPNFVPKYEYPYIFGDGRERPEAGPDVKRVLRGGTAFLSARDAVIGSRFAYSPLVTRQAVDSVRVVVVPESVLSGRISMPTPFPRRDLVRSKRSRQRARRR